MAPPSDKVLQLQGIVKTLTYVNPETGYFIAKVSVEDKGERTVVGTTPVIHVGEQLSALGSWQSSNWGPQFKATDVTLSAPTMLDAIEKYLASAIEGIGKGYAKKMVAALGDQIFKVIEETPEKLYEVPGIGKKRASSIIASFNEQKDVREIMFFLHRMGLSATKAQRVYKLYGKKAIARITENPYLLCQDFWGIGFATADAVAQKQGIPADSDYRISAGIQHVLRQASSSGSCGLPVNLVRDQVSELLGLDYSFVDRGIAYELEGAKLIRDTAAGKDCLFLPKIFKAEAYLASRVLEHNALPLVRPLDDVRRLINDAEVELELVLDETQRDAVFIALTSNICVITGGPGTGKTTITKVILHIFATNGMDDIALCAPTGKAAKRAAESTGFPAMTVHRTLGVERDGSFKFNSENLKPCDVWVLDEWSMGDVALTHSVLSALSPTTRIIIIGDVDQLPSVGPGKVLSDLIESQVVPTVRLTKIFRQAATSDIIKNAHAINAGKMPAIDWKPGSDFCFTRMLPKSPSEEDKTQCREAIAVEVLRVARDMYKLGYDPIRDVQVLAPMRRGVLGVQALNVRLQALLNPHPEATLEVLGTKWGTGDKVMQLKNNYDKGVYNGDVGYVVEVDTALRTIDIEFDEQVVKYKASELDEVVLAYATTIHKSQGSEFPVTVIPLDWSHFTMLKRNLLYTAITRSKKLCVVIGQPDALQVAVRTAQNDERYSTLRQRLSQTPALSSRG